uniref:Glutathione S-transferase T3 n=1 Tax=Noccaea caerulescens TaxID=107243 RepID=A0A1J3JU44_NOCCA
MKGSRSFADASSWLDVKLQAASHDVFEMAYKLYYQDQKSNFTLEHAWRMLRNDQKWCSLSREKGKAHSKRTHPDASVAGSPMEEEVEERPVGVKAAKAAKLKGNKKVTRTSEDREAAMKNLQSVAALREKDYALREKEFAKKDILANKKLLANLLGKTEPLDEIEIDLKNKLISQIL